MTAAVIVSLDTFISAVVIDKQTEEEEITDRSTDKTEDLNNMTIME